MRCASRSESNNGEDAVILGSFRVSAVSFSSVVLR